MSVFSKIRLKKPQYSRFDLSYDHKLSLKMGYLIPVHLQEAIPGDRYRMSSQAMFRMMPLVAPIMHKVDVFMHFFFVPNRLVWPNWEKYITGGEDPNVVPAFPLMNFQNGTVGLYDQPYPSSLANYLGLPAFRVGGDIDYSTGSPLVSAIPFAGYQRIWHEFYRDQNLIPGDPIELTDGVQNPTQHNALCKLQKRAWEHDYFTACLPFAQKGDAVTIPLDMVSKNPTQGGLSQVLLEPNPPSAQTFVDQSLNPINTGQPIEANAANASLESTGLTGFIDPNGSYGIDPLDLEGVATLNDLRTAGALQRWFEKNARAGTRYIETLLAHFNKRVKDYRLQRPEYLGGSKASMAISEVLQTSSTDATTPQGNMAGHGISVSEGRDFSYSCDEHGYIFGLLSVRPRTAYMQGQPRHFSKVNDRTEFYWPDFAHLGEQAVLNQEIYVSDNVNNALTFGYIPRYSEYRYNPSRVSGQMATTLDTWHMARLFATPPLLNQSFVEMDPTKRIFAVTDPDEDEIVAHIYHMIEAVRPMPAYGDPGMI